MLAIKFLVHLSISVIHFFFLDLLQDVLDFGKLLILNTIRNLLYLFGALEIDVPF